MDAYEGWNVTVLQVPMDEAWRWDRIAEGIGSISDTGHDWDDDPAAWVSEQRRADFRRLG